MRRSPYRHPRLIAAALCFAGATAAQSNLLVNGDAESGTLAGWVDALGAGFNISSTTPHTGSFSFWPGIAGPTGSYSHELRQDVDVSSYATAIDAGVTAATFAGFGRSNSAGGATDRGSTVLEFRGGSGTVLATFDTGVFQPFNVYQPFNDVRAIPSGTRTLRVRLIGDRSVGASTDCFFDDLTLGIHEWESIGSGCPGTNGIPAVALESPPWLGDTYRLSLSNLGSGLVLMVSGFTPQAVPLQPFAAGFGSSCTLQTNPDIIDFVPPLSPGQSSRTWELILPNNPLFLGTQLLSQVVELGPPSAVSAVARAVVR